MNILDAIETKLFLASVTVEIFDGEAAQMAWAEFLAGDLPALESAS